MTSYIDPTTPQSAREPTAEERRVMEITAGAVTVKNQHVAAAGQFTRAALDDLFALASTLSRLDTVEGNVGSPLAGVTVAPLFFEASSRTFCSFVSAAEKLGGGIVHLPVEMSSMSKKGESLADTVRTLASSARVVILRHSSVSALSEATAVVPGDVCSIINAGNGTGEHPTQALLDAYTIHTELGSCDDKCVALVGDLKNGRTVHSLARLLSKCFKIKTLICVSPPALAMPAEVLADVRGAGVDVQESENLTAGGEASPMAAADVVYVTRVQKERFESEADYEAVRGSYTVNADAMKLAKPAGQMIVLHPLPRNDELSPEVDVDPRAAYFRQMNHGLYARMALLLRVTGRSTPAIDSAMPSLKIELPGVGGTSCGGADEADNNRTTLSVSAPTPLMNAAGVMCSTEEQLVEVLGAPEAGSIITKSCTLHQRDGNPAPRYRPIPLGSINSMGLPNNGFDYYKGFAEKMASSQRDAVVKKSLRAHQSQPLFFSVSGMTMQESVEMAERLSPMCESGAVIMELNLSCPNVPGKPQVGYDFEDMGRYLEAVTAVHKAPFGVKMPPYFDFAHFDAAADILNRYSRVSFITCINSLGNALVVDVDSEAVVIKPKNGFGGLGGQYALPTALANVHAFFLRCPKKMVFGCGGITNGETAFMHVLAGASMLQIGTQLQEEGVNVFRRVARELREIMARKGYRSLDEFRGKLKSM